MSATDIFEVKGVFASYRAELQLLGKLVGGIPKDPDTIRGWLKARLEMGDRELIELAERTYAELSGEEGRHPSTDEQLDVIMQAQSKGNTFKRNPTTGNLAWEGRCAKAALKEAANIAFPGTEWPGKPGKIKKGLMRFLSETVFVPEYFIDLGVAVPSGTEQRVKHVKTPLGPRSTIAVVDYVDQPLVTFTVKVLDDCLSMDVWGRIWQILEDIGIGAERGASDGKFELVAFDPLPG